MYEEGKGVLQDYKQAVSWYRKAAEQGSALGQSNLGRMYKEGKGVPRDDTQSIYWYQKASKHEDGYTQSSAIYDNFIDEVFNIDDVEEVAKTYIKAIAKRVPDKPSVSSDPNYELIVKESLINTYLGDEHKSRLREAYMKVMSPAQMQVYLTALNSEACAGIFRWDTFTKYSLSDMHDSTVKNKKLVGCNSLLEQATTETQREELIAFTSSISKEFAEKNSTEMSKALKQYETIKIVVEQMKKAIELPLPISEFQVYEDIVAGHNYVEQIFVYQDTFAEDETLEVDKNALLTEACETPDLLQMGIDMHVTWLDINHQHLLTHVVKKEDCKDVI